MIVDLCHWCSLFVGQGGGERGECGLQNMRRLFPVNPPFQKFAVFCKVPLWGIEPNHIFEKSSIKRLAKSEVPS